MDIDTEEGYLFEIEMDTTLDIPTREFQYIFDRWAVLQVNSIAFTVCALYPRLYWRYATVIG